MQFNSWANNRQQAKIPLQIYCRKIDKNEKKIILLKHFFNALNIFSTESFYWIEKNLN